MTGQARSRDWSVALIGAAGLAVVLYGITFLVVNFTAFIEVGLTPDLVGASVALRVENPTLYNYLSHLQVNLAAFIIAYGIVLIALAWFPIRRGQRWAIWTVLGSSLIALAIGLPIHYAYGLATLGHVGPFYVVTAFVLVGSWLGYRAAEA
jgi:hypothetical protein